MEEREVIHFIEGSKQNSPLSVHHLNSIKWYADFWMRRGQTIFVREQ